MNFDVVIIGGGLAGLTCGIALQQHAKRCVIINNGQASIDFASGSMDLLNQLPSGQIVSTFCKSYADLAKQMPQHPYSLIGQHNVLTKAQQFEQLATSLDLNLSGSTQQNHLRITPLGGLRTTWLSPNNVPILSLQEEKFDHQHIAVLGIEGFHDFQPQLLTANLQQCLPFKDCQITTHYLNIPELDQLRQNAREFRSVNIAQLLVHKLAFAELAEEIKQLAGNATAVFLPACFGFDDSQLFDALKQATGLALYELPTLPPSLLGIRQRKQLRYHFEKLGGVMLNGDKALVAEMDSNGVVQILTQLHQQDAITADYFVLASGSFLSNGLVAEFEQIIEPVFGLDIQGCKNFDQSDRLTWTNPRFASPQPYQSAGVIINQHCQARKNGDFLANLYAIGNVIGGYNALELGCGSGVAVVTALTVAEQIISQTFSVTTAQQEVIGGKV